MESVQTFAAKKATAYLSTELQTTVKIERVKFKLIKYLEFEDLYIEDLQHDTLISIKKLQVDLLDLSFGEKNFAISAELLRPVVNIHRHAEDTTFNYQFLIDYFGSDQKKEKQNFSFLSRAFKIKGGRFSYHDFHEPDDAQNFDPNHVEVTALDLQSKDLSFDGKLIKAQLDQLAFDSRNDFRLDSMSTAFEISPEQIICQRLAIKTSTTHLHTDLIFTTTDYSSYSNFVEEVMISSDFRNSVLDLADLAYFVPAMNRVHYPIKIDGKVTGTADNIGSKRVSLEVNSNALLIGEFDIRGLPDVEETFVYFNAERLKFNTKGIRDLPLTSFGSDMTFKLPEAADRLGDVVFKGNFTGYLKDFVAYGSFSTILGKIGTDISLRQEGDLTYYDGSLSTSNFDLGGLLNQEDFGLISMNFDLDGSGVSLANIKAEAIGEVSSLMYKGYNYDRIKLNGDFASKKFTGDLSIRDEYLSLDFVGSIDANQKKIISKFSLDLQEANLSELNLFQPEDSLTQLSFKADFDVQGTEITDFDGSVDIDSLYFRDSEYKYQTSSLQLAAKREGDQRTSSIRSSFLDGDIVGEYKLNQLPGFFKDEVLKQLPHQELSKVKREAHDFEFDLYFKEFEPISEIFLTEFSIDSASRLYGSFSDSDSISNLHFTSTSVAYGRYGIRNVDLKLESSKQGINTKIEATELQLAKGVNLKGINNELSLKNGESHISFMWKAMNDEMERGQIKLRSKIDSLDGMQMTFLDSYFTLNDSLWEFKGGKEVNWRGRTVQIDSIGLGNANQLILLDGTISEDPQESLALNLQEFDLTYIGTFIDSKELDLEGRINGKAVIKDPYMEGVITSDLQVSQLKVNDIFIDEAALKSYWLKDSTGLLINAHIGKGNNPLLSVKGKLDPKSEVNRLDLMVHFNKFPIKLTEPFIDPILSELQGDLNGDIKVQGKANEPLLNGELHLASASMKVNYLNTVYNVDHSILIRPDFIGFDMMEIQDKNGNIATATGTIFHQNYSNFNLDIGIDAKHFLALNTTEKDNDLFYGVGIASGRTNISGYADQLIFEMNMTAEDGTDFKIPLKDEVTLSENDFVVFTNSPQYDEDSTIKVDLSGIQLNFDLKIAPEVKTTIIFDPSIGDIITAQGSGNLKLEINTLGNFNMFGQYELQEGEYLFTLRNIVNKRFNLAAGSKMMWDGDPYEARLDIRAIYNQRASLYDIMPADSTGRYRRRVPVELVLDLGGYLLNPDINFDIRLPGADEVVKSRLQSILYVNESSVNEQELNQQVFGLLVLGRFMPPSSGNNRSTASYGAPGMNNGYELLSNQLSNWLSSVSNEFDVGVSYRPGDEAAQEELDVSLSTEILNDRLVLDGNIGYVSDNQTVENDQATSFIGEFMVEYKLKRDGRLRLRGFNRSNNNDLIQLNSPYTQGVGLFYREEFDNFSEVWRKYFGRDSKDEVPQVQDEEGEKQNQDQEEIKQEGVIRDSEEEPKPQIDNANG